MVGETTTRSPAADEITGSITIPLGGRGAAPVEASIVTKENMLRLFIWVLPIVFTAGALFVSVQTMTARQDAQEKDLRADQDRLTRLEADQRVLQGTVQAISAQQDKLVGKIEDIDEKLNEQRAQLSAIMERLGARPTRSFDHLSR